MKFFFDNNTSPHHALGMAALAEGDGHEFLHLRRKFRDDTPDPDWIRVLGAEGDWIVISGDTRITRNPLNLKAWDESKLTGFFFAEPWMTDRYWKKTAALVTIWETIERQARKSPTGHGFLIPKKGDVLQQVYPKKKK